MYLWTEALYKNTKTYQATRAKGKRFKTKLQIMYPLNIKCLHVKE